MPSGQTIFMENIIRALDRKNSVGRSMESLIRKRPAAEDLNLLEAMAGRDEKSRCLLLDRLAEIGKSLNMVVSVAEDLSSLTASIARIAADKSPEWGDKKMIVAWDHPLIKCLDLPASLEFMNIPVYFPHKEFSGHEMEKFYACAKKAFIGITSADYCIADTSTLTMKSRLGQPRCVSLLPSIHIAVIRLDQILSNLKELYLHLKWDPSEQTEGLTECMTYITGPSKTADIEATLVHGAHGPREMYLFVLKGNMALDAN